jgi:hypothetical protein
MPKVNELFVFSVFKSIPAFIGDSLKIFKTIILYSLILALVLNTGLQALAQTATGTATPEETPAVVSTPISPAQRLLIDTKYNTIGGLQYIQGGEPVAVDDLDELFKPEKDPELNRLWGTSKSSGALGGWGQGLGTGLLAGGILVSADSKGQTNTNIGLGVALGGAVLLVAGSLLNFQAKTTQFGAVERYNQLTREAQHSNPVTAILSTGPAQLNPIEVRFSTLGGFNYKAGEKDLSDDREMENLISPLNDFEVNRMMKQSESSGTVCAVLGTTAVVGVVGSLVGFASTSSTDNRTPYAWTYLGSMALFVVADFFGLESQTAKFNAVQRYNRFAYGEEQLLPQGPSNEKDLLNFNDNRNVTSGAQKP